MSEDVEIMYSIRIAMQLSFIFWFMLGILIFYATFEASAKLWGTLLLLFMVIIFTPFLPDGTGYEDREA